MRWTLYADPRIASDKRTIELFEFSSLSGSIIPMGASAGDPELVGEDGTTIIGHGPIKDFINKSNFDTPVY